MKIDHYIVATSRMRADGLKYRRHRLVDELLKDPGTGMIYWICPVEEKDAKEVMRKEKRLSATQISAQIVEVTVNDYKNITHLLRGMNKSLFKSFIAKNEMADSKVLWYTYPGFSDLSELSGWDKIIYDCSDSWGDPWAKSTGKKRVRELTVKKLIAGSEKRIAKNSDFLFSTSGFLAEKLERMTGKEIIIIENGVDFDKFSKTRASSDKLGHIPSPKIGFVGGIKGKLDFELLAVFCRSYPDINLVLVGPVPPDKNQSLETLLAMPNVFATGGIDYEEVPEYMQSIDVGILPYKKIAYNEAVSPLKLFEYLASGIPVVGIGVPTTQKYHQEGVYSYTTHENDFFKSCIDTLNVKKDEKFVQERLATARQHDWDEKFTTMLALVKSSMS